jgi:hypothetical protein
MQPWSQPLLWLRVLVCNPVALTGPTVSLGTNTPNNATGATGSLTASTYAETATSGNHAIAFTGASVAANTSQTASIWISRGSGTNNRYARFQVGNTLAPSSVTKGFYTELDLQAVTASGPTGYGDGVGQSVSIVVAGGGWNVTLKGKIAVGSTQTAFLQVLAESAPNTFFYAGTAGNDFNYESVGLCTWG